MADAIFLHMFSCLDASQAFHQIKLDKESSDLTCFNTPFGRYKFLRLPYGICSASEVFHRDAKELFKDIEGVGTFIDDILIWGRTEEEHDERLEQVLKKCQEENLKLNKDKCKTKMTELKYLGHTLTREGLRPDESKIQAIIEMPTPKSKKELERFLGCVNYEAKFIPNLAEVTAPLRELLKEKNAWSWDEPQIRAFEKLKKLLTEAPLLEYYDVTKPVTLQCDSSKDGVGAVLKHAKPIAYASKSLTESQKRYAQIEKELYAVVFGCEHFHQYVCGRRITVHTDHKPLVSIVKKPLASAPARLQRLLLRLQKYEVDVVYVPGKLLYTADMLSRAYLGNAQETDIDDEMELHVNMVINSLPVSDKKLKEIMDETAKDSELQAVRKMCMNGWPEEKEFVPALARPYWNIRDEVCVMKGLLLKGDKIVMPVSQRREMLDKVHASHMGNEVTKRRARDVMFWPGMGSQIEDIVQSCSACQKYQKSNVKEPMIVKEAPSLPWKEVATDLFYWNGADYIVVVDYYSKFFEVSKLENTRSETIIHHMKSIFARHGIPSEVRSDNGPQYSSSEFAIFAKQWGFSHTTSSPGYAQSNGLAEKTVQTVKGILKKAKEDDSDPYLAILEYRNTPISSSMPSPMQLLNGRRARTLLPVTENLLKPKIMDPRNVKENLQQMKEKQREFYDRGASPLSSLKVNDPVRLQMGKEWIPGRIVSSEVAPRSYKVKTDQGSILRRNRRVLNPVPTENKTKTCMNSEFYELQDNDDSIVPNNEANDQSQASASPMDSGDVKPPDDTSIYRSRSGRAVVNPAWFKDYVT